MNPQDPTPDELDERREEQLLKADDEERRKNIEMAIKKGWQKQDGIGWVDDKGTIRLDLDGREL